MASRDNGRTAALSLQLSRAHQDLRRRLADVRTNLGRRRPHDDTLLTHCLAFCTALTNHHQGEDDGLFAQLLLERPDLAPTVAKLVEDHGFISAILARVRELAELADLAARAAPAAGSSDTGPPGPADLAAIGRELDGLAAIMDSHFAYEERAIGAALDAGVGDDGWSAPVLRFATP
ncbi:hemerythrin domain-containing protein [Streptomyces sp. NRRL S-350]|uniref:hemerythrin domain-containing protein n=1 Tax=Streptomyces sp. NRRL S-350 TaxID=1463902 RepID=UPI0004BFD494|nr:hemerythrin domain-containing protein [Streptomyces sp. NRRL S-350]